MPRRHDPGRRARIVAAALDVIGAHGVAGLTHRTVAAAADVPLGSTTYHFATLDDLLAAALRELNDQFAAQVRRSPVVHDPGGDLADQLAAAIGFWLSGEPTRVELEYEVYLAALRRPALRPVAEEWCAALTGLLRARTDPVTARALAALTDGICLQVLLTGARYDEAYAREMLARLLPRTGGDGRAGP
ncbi:TetR/AcrR family transcriptional regulator [Streptomyces sp. NPDC050560]|uniref:TetR/AcrR family transcriptional regulator n=1 Tax=Streptomyces sp. NPDC050560 TaxID=3365630 RepID=UPI0037B75F51